MGHRSIFAVHVHAQCIALPMRSLPTIHQPPVFIFIPFFIIFFQFVFPRRKKKEKTSRGKSLHDSVPCVECISILFSAVQCAEGKYSPFLHKSPHCICVWRGVSCFHPTIKNGADFQHRHDERRSAFFFFCATLAQCIVRQQSLRGSGW